jgi:hypothetical protein
MAYPFGVISIAYPVKQYPGGKNAHKAQPPGKFL